jgi:hypothetical protein
MSKRLKLITESLFKTEVVKESYDPSKPKTIKMRGVYIQADVRNGNNRIYEYDVLKPQVDKFIEEKVKTNSALEELEHPSECSINPARVCARTIDLQEDNKSWIGTSVVLASDPKFGIHGTTNGDLLASLLTFDCAVGHSTRSLGNVDESTGRVSDLQLICCDAVLNPSIGIFNDSNAKRLVNGILESSECNKFVNGILESKEFIVNTHGEILEEKYTDFEKALSKMPNTNIGSKKAEYLGNAVESFLKSFMF